MTKTIVFIHGAWMTPLCWKEFQGFFEAKGFACQAPAWPYKDRSVENLRANPAPELARLGVTEIVDHYEKIIRALPEPPYLIGHSFGGLFVQMLLDRGVGAAGVAVDPAPPKGVFQFYPSVFKAFYWILITPFGWRKIFRMTLKQFQFAFVNAQPEAEQRAVYEEQVVPETGRIFFEGATSMFHNVTRVNFQNGKRAPLLLTAGSADHVCPTPMIRSNFQKYQGSGAVTDFKEFPGRAHWIIAQPGWQEVAEFALDWLSKH
jgi:pimeloyl-ACP methyl ester carboxylesterase